MALRALIGSAYYLNIPKMFFIEQHESIFIRDKCVVSNELFMVDGAPLLRNPVPALLKKQLTGNGHE